MDEQRLRIFEDLRGQIAGDLVFDPIGRAAYAGDASLYEIDPLGVVMPRSRAEVAAVVRYAADHGLTVHARGAGTGLAGESLGRGLVIDFSRYLRRVLAIGPDTVTVEPGAILDHVNSLLEPSGRRLAPDPSGSESCTIGGLIAGDAAGARSLRYGTTAGGVIDLEVVFANGEMARLGCEPWPGADLEASDFKGSLIRRIALYLNWHADLIARSFPKSPRNRAGYALHQVATPDGLNLARLIVGSEGTLALITEATLRTVPLPPAQGVLILPFGRLADATQAISRCLDALPSACELVDWRRLIVARDADPEMRRWITEHAEAALVVELEGVDPEEIRRQALPLARPLERSGRLASDAILLTGRDECERWMNLRRVVIPQQLRSQTRVRPVPVVEDVAVPPAMIGEFLAKVQQIFKVRGVNWTFHAHAGDGQMHVRPFLDLMDPEHVDQLEAMASETYDAAIALGGSISGEHGCGLVRSQFIARQYGELAHVFREIKYAFDPQNILNPGKIVCDDPHLMTRNLRSLVPTIDEEPHQMGSLPVLNTPLSWSGRSRADQLNACNGCGACRTFEPTLRMCPTFRATRAESASPRAHVNILRQIAAGRLDPRLWGSEDLRANARLCVHCRLCQDECPAGIDVSSLMIEAKAGYVENHGLNPTDWTFSRVDLWARLSSSFPIVANALLDSPRARWLLERTFGLSRHRVLPRAQRWPFLRRAEKQGLTESRPHESGPRVAYFVDIFPNYFDQTTADAVVSVLRHAGVHVYVPKGQRGCGMPAYAVGDLERARELTARNLRILSEAVRDGYTIVCSEPTATLMLTREILKLTDDLDAELVAQNTMDVGEYLLGLRERGELPEPTVPIHARVGYHQPCHLRTLGIGRPSQSLLDRIPGLDVEFLDRGCSGIAGIFGLARDNFRTSLRAGRSLRARMKEPDIEIGSTECGACRMQMEQGIAKRTHHPMRLLAMAYGLMPELKDHYKDPKPRHELS